MTAFERNISFSESSPATAHACAETSVFSVAKSCLVSRISQSISLCPLCLCAFVPLCLSGYIYISRRNLCPSSHIRQGARMARDSILLADMSLMKRSLTGSNFNFRPSSIEMLHK